MSTMILFVFLALSISVNAPVQDRCGSVYPENASDRPDELVQLHEIKSGLAADLLNQLKAKAGFNDRARAHRKRLKELLNDYFRPEIGCGHVV